jgi:hypothetical protein
MWIDAQGNVYFGDCRPGDREATPAEIAAWNAALAPTRAQRTDARAREAGYATKGHLFDALDNARFRASVKLGITEEQAHALGLQHNQMYQLVWAAWQDILAIEAEP